MDKIEELIQSLATFDEIDFGAPQSEESVKLLEQSLGLRLPPSYRDFIRQHGGALMIGAAINGIYDNQPLMPSEGCTYYDTIRTRNENGLPSHLIVVSRDHDTDAVVCLDSSRPNTSGEYPVYYFDIDSKKTHLRAENFNAYLKIKLQDALDILQEQ